MSYFGPIMVLDVSNKIGSLGEVLRTLRAGWEGYQAITEFIEKKNIFIEMEHWARIG